MKADLHLHSKYSNRPSEWFLRRIGANDSGLVVPAGRKEALVEAMTRLAEDIGLRSELSRRALLTARDYNWDAALANF